MLSTELMVIDPPFRERLAAAKLDSVSRVLACVGHFVTSCFLVTEAVPDAMSLAAFVQTFSRLEVAESRTRLRHELLRSLAAEIRHMHEAGFVHQDLFWRNVLVRLQGARFEFY